MDNNWIVENLTNAFSVWNTKMTEMWSLLTESPQDFKGGTIWQTIVTINGGMQAIGYSLLVLFFAIGIFHSASGFREFQRSEHLLRHFIHFVLAKLGITYGMDLLVYDSISVDGQAADWIEILAVFAVKVAGSDDVGAAGVATMDADRIARLNAVIWDMTTIPHRIEVIHHFGSGEVNDGWTERNLYITITAKTVEEMKAVYHFNRNQTAALEELHLLPELIEDVYCVSGNAAAGSSATGTYHPYGLDCSGFVDGIFYNVTNSNRVIGCGGGAMSRHDDHDRFIIFLYLPGVMSKHDLKVV